MGLDEWLQMNKHTRPLALTSDQMSQLLGAAQLIPQGSRDSFLRSVADRLADIRDPSNANISDAITFVLSSRGVTTSMFMCDAASSNKETENAKTR